MGTPTAPVPPWVRITICLTAAAAVPGMLVAAAFGATLGTGVAVVIGCVAMKSTDLAFRAKSRPRRKPKEPETT